MALSFVDRFRYFFGKKNNEKNHHSNEKDTRGVTRIEVGRDEVAKKYGVGKVTKLQRRTSESLSKDPVYLDRLFGIRNEGTLRLFHEPTEEDHYFPDKRAKYVRKERKPVDNAINQNNLNNVQVYTASVARNSTNYNAPSSSRPSIEPFPYKVYDSPPRRSTLYYGVDSEGKPLQSDEHTRHSIMKGVDGNAIPGTSQNDGFDVDKERPEQQGRRVTVVAPSEMGDIPLMNDYENETNEVEADSIRKTVLRFRPKSSASRSSRDSVKLMVFRSDQTAHPPMVLSRHVRHIPLKKINRTPVLMMEDGRLLKPLDEGTQASHSNGVNKEQNRVRISMAEIENLCKVSRKSVETMKPVYHSRNTINRRNSIRQSLISSNEYEKRCSTFREEPRMSYHYNLENDPMVCDVPVVPSRNRSISQISRRSVTSYDLKQYPRLDNEGAQCYEDDRKSIGEKVRYSTGSYQPDRIVMKNDKPIVVYEVNNFENKNRSISKSSTVKNGDIGNDCTKPKRNSAQKRVVTNKSINPQVEIVSQEPETQKKHGFTNKISIRKSIDNYMNDPSPIYQQQQPIVYLAQLSSGTIPDSKPMARPSFLQNSRSRTSSSSIEKGQKDFCGLTCDPLEKGHSLQQNSNFNSKYVSTPQQTDFENDIDYLCYPGEKLFNEKHKYPTNFRKSNSKLKWRIIIKNQDNK